MTAAAAGTGRSAAVGLALVVVLAALVGLVAVTGSPSSAPPTSSFEPLPSSPGPPCESPLGICPPPDVCPVATRSFSAAELERIRPDVESLVDNSFYSLGIGQHTFNIDLFPGREALAAELERRFGDAVTIQIGTTRYCRGPGHSARCADVQGAVALPDGLHLALTLDHDRLQGTAAAGDGTLHVRYDGPGAFRLETGRPIVAHLVKPGTRTVVGTFTGMVAGTGLGLALTGGQERSIDVLIGLARCDGGLGSALPPGTYGVRAPLGPDGGPPLYLAPEVELTIE